MRRTVDPASETGGDDEVVLSEVVRQAAGKAARRGRCVARPNDRDRLPIEQV
jgi:hypothetical protein